MHKIKYTHHINNNNNLISLNFASSNEIRQEKRMNKSKNNVKIKVYVPPVEAEIINNKIRCFSYSIYSQYFTTNLNSFQTDCE